MQPQDPSQFLCGRLFLSRHPENLGLGPQGNHRPGPPPSSTLQAWPLPPEGPLARKAATVPAIPDLGLDVESFPVPHSDLQTARGRGCSFLGYVPVGIRVPLPEGSEHLVPGTPEHAVAQEILHHCPGRAGSAPVQHQGCRAWRARGGQAGARRTPARHQFSHRPTAAQQQPPP